MSTSGVESTWSIDRKPDVLAGPLAFLGASVLTLIVYRPSLSAWFVADDILWLRPSRIFDLLVYFHSSWGHGSAFRPLVRCSYYLDYLLYGPQPTGWHVTNVILHSCNAAWIFIILRRFARSTTLAGITSLLFTVSPWGHESVAWISGRTHLLCAFFGLPSLYAYYRYLNSGRGSALAASLALYLASLMSYEAAVSLPFVIMMPALFRRPTGQRLARSVSGIATFLGLLSAFLIYRYIVLGGAVGKVGDTYDNYFLGLVLNVRDIAYMFTMYFPVLLPVTALAVVVTLYGVKKNRLRRQDALLLLGIAAVLYVPFSGSKGLAVRFVYLIQISLLIAIAWAALHAMQLRLRGIRVVAVMYLGASALLAAWQTHSLAREWQIAGSTARSIVAQFTEHAAQTRTRGPVVVFGVPDNYGYALVFKTYFEQSVYFDSPWLDGRVFRADHISAKDLQALLSDADSLRLFYDADTGELGVRH